MEVFESMKKALLAGFGVQNRLKEFVDDLVKRGELSESQGAKFVKEWSEKAEKSTDEFNKSVSDALQKALQKMNIPSREDVEKLNKELSALTARLNKLENKPEG